MNKCFITKLPSSVDNDNLPVLGQLRIDWLKQDSLTSNDQRSVQLQTNNSITVKVSGAHFTDRTSANNLGNTKTITAADGNVELYISNDADAVLTIDNKYSLIVLNFEHSSTKALQSMYFDIYDIKYCTNLTSFGVSYSQVYGDISAVSELVNLEYLYLDNTQVSGNINVLSKCVNMRMLKLSSTQISGDISAISKLTNLSVLGLSYTQISGDISAISKLTNLSVLELSYTQISGTIDSLTSITNITNLLFLKGLSLTGDMSKVPTRVNFISQVNRKVNTNFTWTTNGRQNATLLAMEGLIPFDTVSMDNMLIDQATCTVDPNSTDSWKKIISVSGTRTSVSDAAVAAIQNKGITITGVTKQA